MPRTVLAVVLAIGIFAAGLAAAGEAPTGRVPRPSVPAAQGEACVEPAGAMRRDHMKYLLHQRDRTLRQGYREPRHSLKGCIECHAGRETGSVLGPGGFCDSCHAYASVSIDCFECHSARRQASVAARR